MTQLFTVTTVTLLAAAAALALLIVPIRRMVQEAPAAQPAPGA